MRKRIRKYIVKDLSIDAIDFLSEVCPGYKVYTFECENDGTTFDSVKLISFKANYYDNREFLSLLNNSDIRYYVLR